ncbi:PilZ domain-containing protein [Kamptonema cortianum]|nr:PilZ domain-containing protein [Geitlerinema splendidum]MDK3156917.1 PilZ domain-containing protein [Kamptonema cortianum]
MSKFGAQDFCGTRCRFQRLSDAKLFNGWIEAFEDDAILLSTSTESTVKVGEEFRIEAYGNKISASFNAKLISVVSMDLGLGGVLPAVEGSSAMLLEAKSVAFRMEPTSPVRYASSHESVRLRTADIPCMVVIDGVAVRGLVVDVSEHGCGLILKKQIRQGHQVTVQIQATNVQFPVSGQVKHCRADKDRAGWFRCGINIDILDRVRRPKWERLLKDLC